MRMCCCTSLLCVNDLTTVVDTSANYMGGNSEILVGEGVDRWRSSGDGEEKSLTVISKFGYASVSVLQPQLHHDMPLALRENGSQHPPHIEHRPEYITALVYAWRSYQHRERGLRVTPRSCGFPCALV